MYPIGMYRAGETSGSRTNLVIIIIVFQKIEIMIGKLRELREVFSWRKISESWTLEKIKPQINELIHQLQIATDYDTPEVEEALMSLTDIPLWLCPQTDQNSDDSDDEHDNDAASGPIFTTSDYIESCRVVGKYLLKSGYVQLFVKIADNLQHHVSGGSRNDTEQLGWLNFGLLCWGMINYAEYTPEIGREVAQSGGIKILLEALDCLHKGVVRVRSEISNDKMQLLVLCVLYHCRRDNIQVYRYANAVPVLTKYLKAIDLGRKTYALLTLATVIREIENDILKSSDCISFLVQRLEDAIDSTNHTAVFKDVEGISVSVTLLDILDGVNHLVVNDDNKRTFHQLGGTGFAVEILHGQFTDDQKALMSKILWKLAFIEEIKKTETFMRAKACKYFKKQITFFFVAIVLLGPVTNGSMVRIQLKTIFIFNMA